MIRGCAPGVNHAIRRWRSAARVANSPVVSRGEISPTGARPGRAARLIRPPVTVPPARSARQAPGFRVTMGIMSAHDAAPLPRLGEVFFDVRGDSRTMRLSWYADTGVAVFSIWQGGTCTGTFRLPMSELPRMVDTLTHGPAGLADAGRSALTASSQAAAPGPPTAVISPLGRPEPADGPP